MRHAVGTQKVSAPSFVGVMTTGGESFWKETRRPWREGGWDGWGGPGWARKVVDVAIEWRLQSLKDPGLNPGSATS